MQLSLKPLSEYQLPDRIIPYVSDALIKVQDELFKLATRQHSRFSPQFETKIDSMLAPAADIEQDRRRPPL